MRVVPPTEIVSWSVNDSGRDVAVCGICKDHVLISELYYRYDYRWKLVRDHQHLRTLNERSLPCMCRWCKCEIANQARIMMRARRV